MTKGMAETSTSHVYVVIFRYHLHMQCMSPKWFGPYFHDQFANEYRLPINSVPIVAFRIVIMILFTNIPYMSNVFHAICLAVLYILIMSTDYSVFFITIDMTSQNEIFTPRHLISRLLFKVPVNVLYLVLYSLLRYLQPFHWRKEKYNIHTIKH